MTGLRILRAGPATTMQDAGRYGWLRFGITPAGPMDWIAHATANLLAANAAGAAAVEIGPGGLRVAAEGAALRIGLAAPGFRVTRGGNALPTRLAMTLHPGQVLDIAPGHAGVWGYLAVRGGPDLPPVMGSLSSHLRSGIGPGALAAGDVIPCSPGQEAEDLALILPASRDTPPVRILPGPQDDHFTPEAMALLTGAAWTVARRSDRMAWRLAGPVLAHVRGHDIVSDGVPAGAIQVPGDGQPLILMADRQPTGGYPKIATVIRADLPRVAQTRPGQGLRFALTDHATAVEALRLETPAREAMAPHLRVMRGHG